MTASYPSSVKSFTTKVDGVDDVMAVDVNGIQDEVVAIETELGTDPAGTSTTVSERIAGFRSLPGATVDTVTISGVDVLMSNDIRVGGGLWVGTTASDPGAGNLYVEESIFTGGGQIVLNDANTSNGQINIYTSDASTNYAINTNSAGNAYKKLTMQASEYQFSIGSVGIGASPSYLFQVYGDPGTYVTKIQNTRGDNTGHGLWVDTRWNLSTNYPLMVTSNNGQETEFYVNGGGDAYIRNDISTVPLTDYSGTSTIVGWSSFTVKNVFYKKIGKTVHVWFSFSGTSDNTASTFTVPFTSNSAFQTPVVIRIQNNGATFTTGLMILGVNTSTVNLYPDQVGNNWTASGTKVAMGEFFYETA